MALMPHAVSAHGACSRDDPAPKLSPTRSTWRPCISGSVEDEVRVRAAVGQVAPVVEQGAREARLLGRLEEPRGDDLVRVDVLCRQRDELAAEGGVRLRHLAAPVRGSAGSDVVALRPTSGRGSLTTPASAVAAAVSGEARNVRDPLPWRPSKLRLLVDTMYWPGAPWSPFMAMHMEQPASRHSAPAEPEDVVEALALGLQPSPGRCRARP